MDEESAHEACDEEGHEEGGEEDTHEGCDEEGASRARLPRMRSSMRVRGTLWV